MRTPRSWLLLLPLLAAGCMRTDPADEIGRFAVVQTLTDHCGEATLLAAPAERKVVVYLRRVGPGVLHWRQGEELWVLNHDPLDGHFTARSGLLVDMREGDTSQPSCVIVRDDVLEGTLVLDPLVDGATGAHTLEGRLQYDFSPMQGASCDDLMIAEPPLASELPCSIGYDLIGEAI